MVGIQMQVLAVLKLIEKMGEIATAKQQLFD